MVKKLLVLKEGEHKDTNLYIKAIKKEAIKRNVTVNVIDIEGIFIKKDLAIINGLVKSDGIIIANPISKQYQKELNNVMLVWKEKDIDNYTGISTHNNCTLQAIIDALKKRKVSIPGRDVVVLGRRLGKDIGNYLLKKDATVTICHSKTKNLKEKVKAADIVICCANEGNKLVTPDMLKEHTLVVDVGGNTEGNFKNIVSFGEIGTGNIKNIFKNMEDNLWCCNYIY